MSTNQALDFLAREDVDSDFSGDEFPAHVTAYCVRDYALGLFHVALVEGVWMGHHAFTKSVHPIRKVSAAKAMIALHRSRDDVRCIIGWTPQENARAVRFARAIGMASLCEFGGLVMTGIE